MPRQKQTLNIVFLSLFSRFAWILTIIVLLEHMEPFFFFFEQSFVQESLCISLTVFSLTERKRKTPVSLSLTMLDRWYKVTVPVGSVGPLPIMSFFSITSQFNFGLNSSRSRSQQMFRFVKFWPNLLSYSKSSLWLFLHECHFYSVLFLSLMDAQWHQMQECRLKGLSIFFLFILLLLLVFCFWLFGSQSIYILGYLSQWAVGAQNFWEWLSNLL